METKIIFAIRSYSGLLRDAAAIGGFEMGRCEVHVWKDGEIHQKVESRVGWRDVVLIAGTATETDTLEAFDLATALVDQGRRSLALVMAFFGYATMEKAWFPGEAVTANIEMAPGGVLRRVACGILGVGMIRQHSRRSRKCRNNCCSIAMRAKRSRREWTRSPMP